MGVFFNGMKMPENCVECPVVQKFGTNPLFSTYGCKANPALPTVYLPAAKSGRREGCPAQELEMGYDLAEGDSVAVFCDTEEADHEPA